MQKSLDHFIDGCVAEFKRTRAEELGESEEASWPELLDALERAGLGDLRLFLEYELPGPANAWAHCCWAPARTAGLPRSPSN